MICLVRNRSKFYRRTMMDVWGMSITYKKPTKEIKFVKMMDQEKLFRKWYYRREFVYSFRKKIKFKRKKEDKKMYLYPRFLKHFYLILNLDDLRKMQVKSTKKKEYFESTFLKLLECRLFMVVFRLNWITNIFMIKSMIDHGIFTINGKIKAHSNFVSKIGDIIGINDFYMELIRYDLILRYKKRIIFWSTPSYFFLNYKFMIGVFWKNPELKDLEFITDKIDVFLGSEFYFPTPR